MIVCSRFLQHVVSGQHSLRRNKRVLFDGGQDIAEFDLRREGVSVVDNWHSIGSIPAVH